MLDDGHGSDGSDGSIAGKSKPDSDKMSPAEFKPSTVGGEKISDQDDEQSAITISDGSYSVPDDDGKFAFLFCSVDCCPHLYI